MIFRTLNYIRYRFNGLTHIIIECNYARDILNKNVRDGLVPETLKRRIIRSHFELSNVKEFLRVHDLSRINEIWLVHLSDSNSDEARFKREIQALTGKTIMIAKA